MQRSIFVVCQLIDDSCNLTWCRFCFRTFDLHSFLPEDSMMSSIRNFWDYDIQIERTCVWTAHGCTGLPLMVGSMGWWVDIEAYTPMPYQYSLYHRTKMEGIQLGSIYQKGYHDNTKVSRTLSWDQPLLKNKTIYHTCNCRHNIEWTRETASSKTWSDKYISKI